MNRISRRSLLGDSLLAASAAATVGVVHGQAEPARAAAPAKKVGANERVRVACIGFRGQGRSHIGAYAGKDDAEVVALVDVDKAQWSKGIKICKDRGQKKEPRCFQDLRKALDDKTINAVSIATPNHWHALAAILAMEAGKDVYVEKPVSHNVSEGRRMVEAARRWGRICQTGTQCRSYKGTRDAVEYVHDGKIGKLLVARGLCWKNRGPIGLVEGDQPIPESIDYNMWIGPAPMKPLRRRQLHYDWHWIWDYGNGDLGNQGIHQMDIARWGLFKQELPQSVIGVGGRFGYKDNGETPNTHITFCDYGDCQLTFEVRGLTTQPFKGAKVGVIFHGTEGYVVLDEYRHGTAFDLDGNKIREFEGGGDHHGNFLDAVRSRKHTDLNADILQGHLSSALCHLGNLSYRVGEQVPFDPRAKAFGDNKEAFATLERFKDHLKDNSVAMEGSPYALGKKIMIDQKNESITNCAKARAMLTREYRKGFALPSTVA